MNHSLKTAKLLTVPLLSLVLQTNTFGQGISLENLSQFKSPSTNWQIVGGVQADFQKKENLTATNGKGILANLPQKGKQALDIYTNLEHGDADIEFEFMMAKESNSGIYLQGRYEIQLLDSWGKSKPTSGDLGGVYERADPTTEKGFEGYAPRVNAARVPGVWQKMKISFQAPRFDAAGKKIANAKLLNVTVNGQTVHENIELTGPTRGPMSLTEVARGPLRIQGDHGPVAIRNLSINTFDNEKPTFSSLNYSVHDGRVVNTEELKGFKATSEGKVTAVAHSVTDLTNNYVVKYEGKLRVPVAGKYKFNGVFHGGYGDLKVNNKAVIPFAWWENSGEVELPAGDVPFTYTYSKVNEGDKPSLGLFIEGPGIRPVALHENGSLRVSGGSNPILLHVGNETLVHRSFINFKGKTLPYGVSVGDKDGINYSMNLANGSIIRTWRGDFLNTTPMWNDRGNGTSIPLGSSLNLDDKQQIVKVAGKEANEFKLTGYTVNADNTPTFTYEWNGAKFEDVSTADASKKYLERTVKSSANEFTFELAKGKEITSLGNNKYLVDGQYYIQIAKGGTPTIADKDGQRSLTVEVRGQSLNYAIIW